MNLLSPAAIFLALLMPVIVAMYLLKLRRTERIVSSTYLWRQIVRDLEANVPWQRLRRNILLILQLLFLTFLIITIARPFTWTEGVTGQSLILVIDSSASMGSTDISPDRLEAAKSQARQLVEQLPDGARVTIIDAGRKARVIAARSSDLQQISQAIEEIKVGTGGSDMGIALQLASAIAMRQTDTQTIVLSDGNVTLPDRMSFNGKVRYFPIGTNDNNQGIQLLTLQTMPGTGNVAAFAQVFNYTDSPAFRRIALYSDGRLSNVYDLDIPSNSAQSVLMENLPGVTRLVEARLLPDGQVIDYLTADDRAFAVHRQTDPISVTLVTRGNLFLETALALIPGLKITPVDPEIGQNLHSADLTILDLYVPDVPNIPTGNLLFIAPPQSTPYFTINGMIEAPVPQVADTGSKTLAILKEISLDSINILDAVRIPLPSWGHSEIVCDDVAQGSSAVSPLLFTGEIEGRRLAVLAFDLHRSDLPLQIAFPILLANLVQWLTPGLGGDVPDQVVPGEAISFSIPFWNGNGEQAIATITRPDGKSTKLEVKSNRVVFADTDQLGLYRLDLGGDQSFEFVVNLFSPPESRIKPASSLPMVEASAETQAKNYQLTRREWWRYGAVFALFLLVVEWLVYNRSAVARMFNMLTTSLKKIIAAKS
jgi:hypothetical protein